MPKDVVNFKFRLDPDLARRVRNAVAWIQQNADEAFTKDRAGEEALEAWVLQAMKVYGRKHQFPEGTLRSGSPPRKPRQMREGTPDDHRRHRDWYRATPAAQALGYSDRNTVTVWALRGRIERTDSRWGYLFKGADLRKLAEELGREWDPTAPDLQQELDEYLS